jgi:hypothetical protein
MPEISFLGYFRESSLGLEGEGVIEIGNNNKSPLDF